MIRWLGSDHAPLKWPIGNEANLLIVIVAGALTIDTSKLIAANVVADQLGGYNLISVSGVQATSDNQKKWCSLRTPWIDNLGVDQVMRLPRDWVIG
jgi:hypothetical protein